MRRYANYALVYVGAHLGEDPAKLDVEWAEFVGDETADYEFEVPTPDATDAYIGLQVFDVGAYGHELVVNDEPLTGFDIPPGSGWQYWVDAITEGSLVQGVNTIRIARDAGSDDNFVVGTATIHWKEPIE